MGSAHVHCYKMFHRARLRQDQPSRPPVSSEREDHFSYRILAVSFDAKKAFRKPSPISPFDYAGQIPTEGANSADNDSHALM